MYLYPLMLAEKKTRVVVGMSGGVDSSATAALLLEQGFEVVGITLKLWPQDCVSRADQLGAQYVATGHFARLEKSADGARTLLKRGCDSRKDQSYFLFSLRQHQLARALFPLGDKTKSDTRQVARHCNLKTADKPES